MAHRAKSIQCSGLLREAVLAGDLEAVRTLLGQKLEMPPPNDLQLTCLWEAVRMKNFEIAELLVRCGADVNQRLDQREGYRRPSSLLLELAVWSDQEKAIRLGRILIEQGADINARGGYMEDTVLNLALHVGNLGFAEMLLENGARTNGVTRANLPAVIAAALSPRPVETIRLVLKYDPVLKRRSFVNGNALHCISENCVENTTAARLLLDRGASLADRDEFGFTPFHRAVARSKKQLVTLFLERGVDIDQKTNTGESPIFLAIKNFDISMLELLLTKGADITGLISQTDKISLFAAVTNDSKDENKPKLQSINKIIMKELAKVEFNKLPMTQRNLEAISLIEENKTFYDSCLKELEKMESTKFYGDYSYYFVLQSLKNRKNLAEIAENVDFVTGFFNPSNNGTFDIYGDDLNFIMSDALKKRDYVKRLHSIFNKFLPKDILYSVSQYTPLYRNTSRF